MGRARRASHQLLEAERHARGVRLRRETQFNANWIAELPFGKGKLIGGMLTGLSMPSLAAGRSQACSNDQWPPLQCVQWLPVADHWQLGGNAFLTGGVNTGRFKTTDSSGNAIVSVFKKWYRRHQFLTNPFPGDSGARNQVRGDGFFNVDMGLSKRFHMPWSEKPKPPVRWEVFNITNTNRFEYSPSRRSGYLFPPLALHRDC